MFLINDIGCTSVNCCFMLFVRTKSNGLKILISNYNKCEKLGPGSCSVASSKYNNICGGSVYQGILRRNDDVNVCHELLLLLGVLLNRWRWRDSWSCLPYCCCSRSRRSCPPRFSLGRGWLDIVTGSSPRLGLRLLLLLLVGRGWPCVPRGGLFGASVFRLQ